ncbi:MAG: ATP-binding protein [Alphaproteobacteria bacterium]|nr:ATP-binding protein [Alphaproteobacteria bacterium]
MEATGAYHPAGSIKGLAQALTKPAYGRFRFAEPALRRAVPLLIIGFLITTFLAAFVQVADQTRQKQAVTQRDISALADILAERLDNLDAARQQAVRTAEQTRTIGPLPQLLPALLPSWGMAGGRHILVTTSAERRVLASISIDSSPAGSTLHLDSVATAQLLASSPTDGSLITLMLPGGTNAIATSRLLRALPARISILQEKTASIWGSTTALSVTVPAVTGFVVLLLGFAFHWQSTRAREGDLINDAVRERIDTALNRGRCGLWDWDLSRGRIFWSQSMFAMLGLNSTSNLLTFGDVNDLVKSDDIDLFAIANQLLCGQITHIDQSFRMRHVDGHWVWLRVRCELTQSVAETDLHLIGIALDISEQKNLAERTAEADLRLRDAIDTIPEAFVLWDANDRLVLCNSHFQRLHKLPENAVLPGTSYESILEIGRMPRVRTRRNETVDEVPGARTFEAQLDDSSWLHISERRTKDGGYVSVGTDITRIKEHEQRLIDNDIRLRASVNDLKRSRTALEQQALELADLAEKYQQEKTRAEEASQSKSKFLANMSHELRTPLNAIIGFSEIMGSGMFGELGSDKYQEYCKDILNSGHYLLEVINDILDMSKIEAGRMDLDPEPIDLSQTLTESLRVVLGRAQDKKLTLDANVTDRLPVVADRRATKQIIVNLLSNAVKFTPDGGRVIVRCRPHGSRIVLTIADTGIGIPSHSLARLGHPFEQVESQLTKSYHGSGLGLAIARSLVRLHGGTMRLRSRLGTGTVVRVTLPRGAATPHPATELPAPPASASAEPASPPRSDSQKSDSQKSAAAKSAPPQKPSRSGATRRRSA